MRAVENVNNFLAERNLREKKTNKSKSSQPSQSSNFSITSPEWKETWAVLLNKINQKCGSADFQRTALLPSSVMPEQVPKYVWEYLSMGESQSRALAEAEGLSQMGQNTRTKRLLPVTKQNIPVQQIRHQRLIETLGPSDVRSRHGSDASKKAVKTKASELSWKHATIEELNKAPESLQLDLSPTLDISPRLENCLWECLGLSLKTGRLEDCGPRIVSELLRYHSAREIIKVSNTWS